MKDSGLRMRVERQFRQNFLELCREQDRPASPVICEIRREYIGNHEEDMTDANKKRAKLENLIHRIFDTTRMDIEINDCFGNPVVPREWFFVPFSVVDEAVERIKDGSIKSYLYDPNQARLSERKAG